MKSLIVCNKATVTKLQQRLKQTDDLVEFKRIQCVLLRLTLDCSAADIAQLLGWTVSTVHVMHSRWSKQGLALLDVHRRGGRHRQHLTPEQEQQLLQPFLERAQAGQMLAIAEIQQLYQEHVGKAVARSTVYRLLRRNGWRKVVPRPRHPKANVAEQAAFKKNCVAQCAEKCADKARWVVVSG